MQSISVTFEHEAAMICRDFQTVNIALLLSVI